MRFADYAKIYLKAGHGGPGSVSLRREKFVPKGGPDGGDGGRGGHIIFKGNAHMNTLLDLRYRKFIKAENGHAGSGALRSGADAKDEILEVPLGTVVHEFETRRFIGEITEHGQELIVARGGMGGKGNAFFKSATHQTPRFAQPGMPGEEIIVEVELKLIADVGLVGYPNAGKSTLLAAISAARPKIADYPFTTLEPNLGVVELPGFRSFVMADIPGIIEDAHLGKGMGVQFLRHIERNKVLLLLVASTSDILFEYHVLLNEMSSYNPKLVDVPRLVVITKMDLVPDFKLPEPIDLPGERVMYVSAATGYGLDALKEAIWERLKGSHASK
jgi:GTP-binding protein